jgi:pyruvate/2-oxoglutarate dehydrogenase complex dihydrolipoamide acyltransferase (E2) component
VVVVHHRSHAVKPVAVKLVLVHPPARVGQQEAQRLPVPCGRGWIWGGGSVELVVRCSGRRGVWGCRGVGAGGRVGGCAVASPPRPAAPAARLLSPRPARRRTVVEQAAVPHPVVAARATVEVLGVCGGGAGQGWRRSGRGSQAERWAKQSGNDSAVPCGQSGADQAAPAPAPHTTPPSPNPPPPPRTRAVEHVDAVVGVLRRVAVHNVHQHHHAQAVRLVDERLELVGRAAAGGDPEEVGDVVAKGAIVT